MIGDISVSVVVDDGYVRKIVSDEAEVDSAEQDVFISAQIILSEQDLDAAYEAEYDGRDAVDGAAGCADDCAASGERKSLLNFGY